MMWSGGRLRTFGGRLGGTAPHSLRVYTLGVPSASALIIPPNIIASAAAIPIAARSRLRRAIPSPKLAITPCPRLTAQRSQLIAESENVGLGRFTWNRAARGASTAESG